MIRTLSIVALLVFAFEGNAQRGKIVFDRVEPPFWWTEMKDNSLQILLYSKGTDLSSCTVEMKYPGVTLGEVTKVENPHYLFVNLTVSPEAKPGVIPFTIRHGKKATQLTYELKARVNDGAGIQGFNSSDVMYLIMPDRFANGEPKNDSVPGMYEGAHRAKPFGRHGGDIQGIRKQLDYITDLGVTALWLNPVLENNQRSSSYHGYAITDLYAVDKRFGGNAEYLALIDDCHKRGMKVIQDMVMNHIGNEHWLVKDLPQKDWLHQFPEFTRSNYRSTVVSDPYHASADAKLMNDGWFDTTMPDVNQSNPLFAKYLIQNTIWWIEYARIDGIRMDTYPYPDKHFMAEWARQVMDAYPSFNIVGEVWIDDVATTAYWQKGAGNADGYESHLPSVTDFPMFFAVPRALNSKPGWDSGLMELYTLLCKDFNYPNPNNNVVFLDNHDVSRFFFLCQKDIRKYKQGMLFLLTTRGVPQLYYGSEILMDGDGAHHPDVRLDFPGGWAEDPVNAFDRKGRTDAQEEAHAFLRTLLHWRKNQTVIHSGRLTHYIPHGNVYVYFRRNDEKTVMVILNGNNKDVKLDTGRFADNMNGTGAVRDVLNNRVVENADQLDLPPYGVLLLEWNNGRGAE